MNWKINYWTLLFALAALGLVYQWYATGQSLKQKNKREGLTVACSSGQDFSIPDTIATMRLNRYKGNYAPKVRQFAADSCNTLNGGVYYFGIKECELQAMVDTFQNADSITAVLGLIPGTNGAKDTLDLMFEIFTTMGPILVPKYYDFTKPCPPCAE